MMRKKSNLVLLLSYYRILSLVHITDPHVRANAIVLFGELNEFQIDIDGRGTCIA